MVNPFQEQLLKSGLVTKDKVNKANKSRHKQAKQQPKKQAADDECKQQIKQAELLKQERDKELNRQKFEEANKKAITAQIKQLVEMNCLPDEQDGDTAFNFPDGTLIKRIHVRDAIRKQIINGRLAIVRLDENYKLVPKKVAEKIMQRDASFVVVCNDSTQTDENEDDEYAEFKVPDDLMW